MKTGKKLLLVAAALAVLPGPGLAADSDDTRPAKPPATDQNPGTQTQVSKLAAKYDVPPAEITSLRSRGLGWGEIGHALAIAQRAGVSVDDVMKLRRSGMGWGRISQKYGFKLGAVTGRAKEIAKAGRSAERTDRGLDRADARGRGGEAREHGFSHEGRGGPRR